VGALEYDAPVLYVRRRRRGPVRFGFALIFSPVVGPTLGGLGHGTAGKVNETPTPELVFFFFGFSLATVFSGTLLLAKPGLGHGFSGFWPTLALGTRWGLFALGLLVPNRLHLRAYHERISGDPDPEV
jgi:hypothetical protein